MGQDMLAVCHKCKEITCIGSFTHGFIDADKTVSFFIRHKGHPIQIIGDDGGWEIYIDKLINNGYRWVEMKE